MVEKPLAGNRPVNFERPPVDEVYISLQTKAPVFPSDNFGELVEIFGTQFPKLNAQPKLDRNVEFDETVPPSVQLELIMTNMGQRFWLISQDDTRVLQVQDDRIVYNWRQRGASVYPRYDVIRDEFRAAFDKIVAARKLDSADLIDFCEVSYTNFLEMPDGTDPRGQLHRIFKHVLPIDEVATDRLAVEETTFNISLRILDDEGKFMGRMRVLTQPAVRRTDKKFIFQSRFSYRGKPSGPSADEAFKFCDDGHRAIVTAFRNMATEEMRKFWGEQ